MSRFYSGISAILFLLPLFISCKKKEDEKLIYKDIIWSDEFDGSTIDNTRWSFQTGGGGWGNSEDQYYTSNAANASVSGGTLKITALYQPSYSATGYNYTSARIRTYGKADWKYGRIEARIKAPSAAGVWPAFWMLPNTGPWPNTGEIDIMELKNANPTLWNGTLHYYCTPCSGHQYSGPSYTSPADLSQDFHEYAVEWESQEIRWYVDGKYMGTQTPSTTIGNAWPFNSSDNFYIILNVAVGGTYPGQAPVSTQYPTTMEVDYVRVYKR
ncbi:MAG: glycoside hydrolase family 16 protein [Cytophagaceae bacterium]|nr:glycoside hydrolase family 16 protein [Cytophagaceae bacterium]